MTSMKEQPEVDILQGGSIVFEEPLTKGNISRHASRQVCVHDRRMYGSILSV